MKITTVKVADLKPSGDNPRRHSARQVDELVRSLGAFGQYRPLVVDENNVVLAGNGLLQALVQRGDDKAAAYVMTDLSEADKKRLMVADNRLGDMGADDYEALHEVLRSIGDFDVPGYDEGALRDLLSDAEDFLEDAENYGVLPTDEIEKALSRSDQVAENDAQASESVGKPPAPITDPASSEGDASDHPSICPTCGQSWL